MAMRRACPRHDHAFSDEIPRVGRRPSYPSAGTGESATALARTSTRWPPV